MEDVDKPAAKMPDQTSAAKADETTATEPRENTVTKPPETSGTVSHKIPVIVIHEVTDTGPEKIAATEPDDVPSAKESGKTSATEKADDKTPHMEPQPGPSKPYTAVDMEEQSVLKLAEAASIASRESLARFVGENLLPKDAVELDIISVISGDMDDRQLDNTMEMALQFLAQDPDSPEGSLHSRKLKCCGINICDWFPKMCSCVDGGGTRSGGGAARKGSYERIASAPTLHELTRLRRGQNRDRDSEKQEELCFYNDDETFQKVVVEKDLCASDLCQFLTMKNRVVKDVAWTIIESWPELGIERSLEDHEDILSVHRDMESFTPHYEKRFLFSKDYLKYEFFNDPQQFFRPDMLDFKFGEFAGLPVEPNSALQDILSRDKEFPPVYGSGWSCESGKTVWTKIHIVLKGRKLYVMPKGFGTPPKRPAAIDTDKLEVLAHLSDYHIYTTLNAIKYFRAPTEWGICLRPSSNAEAEGAAGGELRCISFEDEQTRACWLIAMRLAKYGKQLRENYRAFKNKQCEPAVSTKEYSSYNVPDESIRSRVAMDFTGSTGRIVEDPKEAKAIAAAEASAWKRRWKPPARNGASGPSGHDLAKTHGLEAGVHITQPWFHSGMTRDQAASLVSKHGTVDGVFLVRDSRSSPGAFVLTYKSGGKVLHTQIVPKMDHVRQAYCYTLDNGVTKFYDLLQLVEFYQLNSGCLPTRLTHYVVQSSAGPVLQQQSDTSMPSTSGTRESPSSSPVVTPSKPSRSNSSSS